jgi:hypothetical protein
MLACTILYTLAGGFGANDQPLDFDELMEATEIGFDDESLFDGIRVGKRELADLLSAIIDSFTPLTDLLKRPFYWSRLEIIEFLGEEVGSMLDPAATAHSGAQQYAFSSALEAHADKEVTPPRMYPARLPSALHCARSFSKSPTITCPALSARRPLRRAEAARRAELEREDDRLQPGVPPQRCVRFVLIR